MRFRAGIPVSEILGICRPHLSSAPDPSSLPASIGSLEPPESSAPDSLTAVGDRVPLRVRGSLRAALVLVEPAGAGSAYGKSRAGSASTGISASQQAVPGDPSSGGPAFGGAPVLVVSSLHAVLAALIEALSDRFLRPAPFAAGAAGGNLVSPTAVVDGVLEGGVTVGAGACIGTGSHIGAGTRIGPNVVIHEHCLIGRDCVIQAGAVIGAPGFGFFPGGGGGGRERLRAMPHAGGVEIGDRCWVGANSVIAAGVLAPTVLGGGGKVDSLVQIAHNVRIGEGALIASQCGIAGSTEIGRNFRMGGSAGLGDHLRIGDGVSVAAFSGVTKDLPDGVTVAGFPARPIAEWRRQELAARKLGLKNDPDRGSGRGPA